MIRLAPLLAAVAGLILSASPALARGPSCGLHAFAATVTRVVDGDTVVADIRLGFGFEATNRRIRLAGIDAPELKGNTARAAAAAREALRAKIEGRDVILCTLPDANGEARRDGFGRIIGVLWRKEPSGYLRNVNVWMVLSDHAEPSWKPLLLRDLLPGS